jgi:pimeloyl-ACP methyl ester carboxylesterase
MFKKTVVRFITGAGIVLASATFAFAQPEPTPEVTEMTAPQSGYAEVNGLYYEMYGSGGQPLILLHGGLGSTDMFAALTPTLAQNRQVIAVDLQGHGRTADLERPLSFEAMADDVAALIEELSLGKADLLGYSLGGGVALQTAIRHPEVVNKLVLVSTVFSRQGWYPEVLQGMSAMNADAAQAMIGSPVHNFYRNAPQPENWPVLVTKLGELLSQDYDWSADVAALQMPVLIVVGDADSVKMSHATAMFELFGGGQVDGSMGGLPRAQFAVLPNTLHWNILMRADLLLPVVMPFLDAPAAANS